MTKIVSIAFESKVKLGITLTRNTKKTILYSFESKVKLGITLTARNK